MSTSIQHPPGKVIKRHMTEPPADAPYFPDWHDKTGTGRIYSRGEFLMVWVTSLPGGGYANSDGVCLVDYADGTWERFDLGPPYHHIARGTWEYM